MLLFFQDLLKCLYGHLLLLSFRSKPFSIMYPSSLHLFIHISEGICNSWWKWDINKYCFILQSFVEGIDLIFGLSNTWRLVAHWLLIFGTSWYLYLLYLPLMGWGNGPCILVYFFVLYPWHIMPLLDRVTHRPRSHHYNLVFVPITTSLPLWSSLDFDFTITVYIFFLTQLVVVIITRIRHLFLYV